MTIDLTTEEAQIVIAALLFAEGAAMVEHNLGMTEALQVLRPWRTKLLEHYMHAAAHAGTLDPGRCVCGGGWTFDFAARKVYCRTCDPQEAKA